MSTKNSALDTPLQENTLSVSKKECNVTEMEEGGHFCAASVSLFAFFQKEVEDHSEHVGKKLLVSVAENAVMVYFLYDSGCDELYAIGEFLLFIGVQLPVQVEVSVAVLVVLGLRPPVGQASTPHHDV